MVLDELLDTEPPAAAEPLDAAAILARVRALRPALQARGEEIDALRRIPDDLVEDVRRTGVLRMMTPRAWGGPELGPVEANVVLEELALGNAAVAWCAMIQMDGGLYGGWLPRDTAREVLPRLDMGMSNVIRPLGRARRVDGGVVASGRWTFASGCLHADWFAGGCLLVGDDGETLLQGENGQPLHRMVLVRREQLQIHDTWHTTGLRGTGSHDVEVEALFVPDHHIFSFDAPVLDGPYYRWPAILCSKMPGVALGIARSAVETTEAALRARGETAPQLGLALADARTLYAAARAYVHGTLETLWTRLCRGEQPSEQERADVVLARAHAFQASRSAVQLMYDALGATAIYARQSPLDRHLRDINTACQHVMAQRKAQQAAGLLLLGVLGESFGFL